jgi:hypothetical protein
MKISRRAATIGGFSLVASGGFSSPGFAWDHILLDAVEDVEAFKIASDAYVYGYPLVTMEMTRRVMTNAAAPETSHAPMGQFAKLREYPTAAFRDVTAPNADTLYTLAWLDLAEEPWVLSIPDMKGRYFLMPMLDGWTEVFQVPGKRTTGTGAQTYLIAGPGWKGKVPAGVKEYKAPTDMVWILGRIYCTGTPEDYAEVHALQDEFKLVPLSSYGKDYTPPPGKVDPTIDMKTAVREQVNRMTATQYFTLLAELMKRNPPSPKDAPALERFAKIGLAPGKFESKVIDGSWETRLPKLSFDRILAHLKFSDGDMSSVNGWLYSTKMGLYGTNYLQRALVTAIGLGANRPEDAVYPMSMKPSLLETYDGSKKWVMRFPPGQLPPVNGFWSLTMYDEKYFFVANPINRYSMSIRTNPKLEKDGSLVIYIQNESPGPEKEANWLPAPKGKFQLMLRLYWPKEHKPSILNGSWVIPPVTVAN